MSFRIVREEISGSLLPIQVEAGGVVTFEGRVRNVNEGREVMALEYEAFDALAEREGEKILEEARGRFDIVEIAAAHRVGRLELGEVAIRVEAAAGHRREAFEACEFVVDEAKRRVPIWKKEHYADGPSEWLHADGRLMVTDDAFYARQMRVPDVGAEGQERLRRAKVLVVGAGGLGCPALTYLAAAGVGELTVVDSDDVEASNLHRQPLYRAADIGKPKAVRAAERLRQQNPLIRVNSVRERLELSNVRELVRRHDLVLDGTDNFATKFLLNDACVQAGIPLVLASVHRWEGQVQMIRPKGPCLRCLWPMPPTEGCVGTCADDGIVGVVPGALGTLAANLAIRKLLGLEVGAEVIFLDVERVSTRSFRVPKDLGCPACGEAPVPLEALNRTAAYEIGPGAPLDGFLVVDIREADEVSSDPFDSAAVHLPSGEFHPDSPEMAGATRVLLVCQRGARSSRLARDLVGAGQTRFFSLSGGIDACRKARNG